MPSTTVENYLKQLFLLQQQTDDRLVGMGRLAAAVQVTPGTATSMVKTLAESGLVEYEPRGGVRLNKQGERLAVLVLRRHRLVELFLVEVLGLDWSQVHDEAEVLEHAISDKVLERIDAVLGNPQFDPHGDPIPTAAGKFASRRLKSLAECEVGRPVRIARVVDQDEQFLRFADEHGLTPGIDLVVESRDALADAVRVKAGGRAAMTVGTKVAGKILVEAGE
jgi:DtxR family Mn-dependent transcriptional regulator